MNTTANEIALSQADDQLLADLFAAELPEIVEPADVAIPGALSTGDAALDELLGTAALTEAIVPEQDLVEQEAPAPEAPVKKGGKKGGSKKKQADADTGSPATDKEVKEAKQPKEPKLPRPTSITHSPGDLLMAKLGANARDMLVFDIADAELPAEELQAKQDAFIAQMNDRDAIADKVRDKIIQLLTGLATGSTMNEVMRRAFMVLKQDGKLTSGDKGNLQTNLLSKPYSVGTARSQANQIFMAFPLLGICKKERGLMVANENSTILQAAYAQLGL